MNAEISNAPQLALFMTAPPYVAELQRIRAVTLMTLPESGGPCYLRSMAPYMRKLVITAFAILALVASNFAMVGSGMAHGTDSAGRHMTAGACEAARDLGAAGHTDDHSCTPAPKGMCGDGPTCCSNACQALIMTSDFASFRQKVELVEPLPMSGSFTSTMTLLDRPPRA